MPRRDDDYDVVYVSRPREIVYGASTTIGHG